MDTQENAEKYKDEWENIEDKRYSGINRKFIGIYPIKNPFEKSLTVMEQNYNKIVSSDFNIVEKFFGRLS